jgi:hypothetical protein
MVAVEGTDMAGTGAVTTKDAASPVARGQQRINT